MKSVLTVLLATVAVLGIAQDTSKPVEYVARALPLHQVLLDLEKKMGVRLDCDPAMENEPLILKLSGVPLQDALDKIALVFAADWVKHDNVLRLERSPAKIEALRKELFAEQVASLKKSIASLVSLVDEQKPLDTVSAETLIQDYGKLAEVLKQNRSSAGRLRQFEMSSRMPTMRLAIQILSRMDPAELVQLSERGRFVYSTRPNSVQHQIPEIDPQWLQDWRSSRQAMAAAREKLVRDKLLPKPDQDNWFEDGTLMDTQVDDRLPSRIQIVSQYFGTTLPIYLSFTFYDEEGRVLAQDGENLGEDYKETFSLRQNLEAIRRQALQTGFELGPVGKELAPRTGANRANARPLPQFVFDALSHPTKQDPLSFAASDIILTSADRAYLNAIALLDDSAEGLALGTARTGKTNLESLETLIERQDAFRVEVDDRWLVAKPTDPLGLQERRAPRQVMEDIILTDLDQGFLTIEQVAEAAYRSNRYALGVIQGAPETLLPSNGNNPTYSDWSALWLYASLSPSQRETAATSEGLSLTAPALSPEQIEVATNFVFQGDSGVDGVVPTQQVFKPGDIYPEPEKTDYFPEGVSTDCILKFTVETQDVVFAEQSYGQIGMKFWYPMDPGGMPSMLAIALHPELFPTPENAPTTSHFKPGVKRTLTVRLAKGKVSVAATASEQHLGAGDPLTAQQYIDSLPDAQRITLQRQIDEALKRIQMGREASGQVPPAPETQKPPVRF